MALTHLKILEALELLNIVIAYNPNYVASRLKLAQVYLNNNNLDEARTHYQKVIEFLAQSDEEYVVVNEGR